MHRRQNDVSVSGVDSHCLGTGKFGVNCGRVPVVLEGPLIRGRRRKFPDPDQGRRGERVEEDQATRYNAEEID